MREFVCALLLAGCCVCAGAAPRPKMLRVSLICMSSVARQVLVRGQIVRLPVAQRVDVMVREGETVTIVSDTDRHVHRRMVVTEAMVKGVWPVE